MRGGVGETYGGDGANGDTGDKRRLDYCGNEWDKAEEHQTSTWGTSKIEERSGSNGKRKHV